MTDAHAPTAGDQANGRAVPAAPRHLDLSGHELVFDDSFDGHVLDESRWLAYYLPQWSSRAASRARYELTDGRLVLRIDEDQAPWSPEFDGRTRVSSLQTGLFGGPLGSPAGQHRFTPGLVVREEQPTVALFTPQFGVVEIRAAATDDPDALVALWMIGFEDEPHRSAEICVMEIFGKDVHGDRVAVGTGIHPFGDATLVDEFSAQTHPIDARQMHSYAVRWTEHEVAFYLDGELVKVVHQSPQYAMQLMLNIYDLGGESPSQGASYPKTFVVDHVRGYRLPQGGPDLVQGRGRHDDDDDDHPDRRAAARQPT